MKSPLTGKLIAAEQQLKLLDEVTKSREVVLMSNRKISIELRESPPIFLSQIQLTRDPVIIVSAKKEEGVIISPPKKEVEQPKESNLLEMTGTPLPSPFSEEDMRLLQHRVADFGIESLPENEKFLPLSTHQARVILRIYNERIDNFCHQHQLNSNDVCSVYIPCDASAMKIALLQSSANGKRPFSYTFSHQEEKCDEERVKVLRQIALKKAKELIIPDKSKLHNYKMECMHLLQWKKLERCVTLEDGTRVTDGNGISVKVIWNEISKDLKCLDNLPLSTAPAIIEAQLDYNYKKWESGNLKNDLLILKDLQTCVETNVMDTYHQLPSSNQTVDVISTDFVTKLLYSAKAQPYVTSETQESDCNDFMKGMEQVKTESRRNMDVTDYIWNALKHGKTLGAIGRCMENIFEECIVETPFVLPTNHTKVSKIITSMPLLRSAPSTSLLPSVAADYLLEIGYLKLVRDVVFLCQVSGARNKEDAERACGVELTTWPEKLSRLEHVQQCIEFLIQANLLLSLNSTALGKILNAILDKDGPLVTANIKAADIINLLKGLHPPLRVWNFKCTKTRIKVETKRVVKTSTDDRKRGKEVEYEYVPVETKEVIAKATSMFVVSKPPIFHWLPATITEATIPDKKLEHIPVDVHMTKLAPIFGSVYCATISQIYNT